MAYPKAFRQKVLEVREKEKLSIREVAERFCIAVASVVRWRNNPEPKITRNKPATKVNMEALKKDVEQYPDAYQFERAKRLGVCTAAIHYALKRLGVSYKKNSTSPKGRRRKAACLSGKN